MMNETSEIDITIEEEKALITYVDINRIDFCFNFSAITRLITKLFDDALSPAEITSSQFTLLITLDSPEFSTMTQIAQLLSLDRTTLARNLAPLQRLDLIKQEPSADRRAKIFKLTSKGHDAIQTAFPLWEKLQYDLTQAFGPNKHLHMLSYISDLNNVLTRTLKLHNILVK